MRSKTLFNPRFECVFFIVYVLKRDSISKETTRKSRLWLRVFFSKKVRSLKFVVLVIIYFVHCRIDLIFVLEKILILWLLMGKQH